MNLHEKEALLTYLEFQLMKFVEQYERSIEPNLVYSMYDDANGIVSDMERSLQTIIEMQESGKKKQSKN